MSFTFIALAIVIILARDALALRQFLRLRSALSSARLDLRISRARVQELSYELAASERTHETIVTRLCDELTRLEDDLHEREDEAALVITMGREMRMDANGTTDQSEEWQRCAAYYLDIYREVLAEVEESAPAEAGPVNVDANGAPVGDE